MPQQLVNDFTEYKLSPEEEILGSSFTELQQAVLQNMLCEVSRDKINLHLDPDSPNAEEKLKYELAFMSGRIAILREIINRSVDVAAKLEALAEKQRREQESNN